MPIPAHYGRFERSSAASAPLPLKTFCDGLDFGTFLRFFIMTKELRENAFAGCQKDLLWLDKTNR
jgi:hypothetical protein